VIRCTFLYITELLPIFTCEVYVSEEVHVKVIKDLSSFREVLLLFNLSQTMMHLGTLTTLENLNTFKFERLINGDPESRFLLILGSFPHLLDSDGKTPANAIIRIEKTAFNISTASQILGGSGCIQRAELDKVTEVRIPCFIIC